MQNLDGWTIVELYKRDNWVDSKTPALFISPTTIGFNKLFKRKYIKDNKYCKVYTNSNKVAFQFLKIDEKDTMGFKINNLAKNKYMRLYLNKSLRNIIFSKGKLATRYYEAKDIMVNKQELPMIELEYL